MFINDFQPQPVWTGSREQHLEPSSHNESAVVSASTESQLRDQVVTQQIRQLLLYYSQDHPVTHEVIREARSVVLSRYSPQIQDPHPQRQYRLQRDQNMTDESKYFSHMADIGDECYLTEDLYGGDCFPGIPGLGMPNDSRVQTTVDYVSAAPAPAARGLDPSQAQHQLDKGPAGNDHFFWPPFQTTPNMYPHPFGSSIMDPRPYSMSMFDHPSGMGHDHFLNSQHGLPSSDNAWAEPDMPLLGEASPCSRVSPTDTAYSSFSSSNASDALASMSLDPITHHDGTPNGLDIRAPLNDQNIDMGMNCPSTVSPKLLRIIPSPAPTLTSPSEPMHIPPFNGSSGGFSAASSFEQHHVPPAPSSKRTIHKNRKELPSKPKSSRHLSVPSDISASRGKNAAPKQPPSTEQSLAHRSKQTAILPRPPSSHPANSDPESPTIAHQVAERSKKDDFLIKSKLSGMTYREIRRKGNFTEAESTLRGRFRTLTKHKDARVRKPEWEENDIRLLKKAVRKLAKGDDPATSKIPWKQVAEYISNNGGSYHFGNATCRKRWDELMDQAQTDSM